MKKLMRSVLCLFLILTCVIAPISASAASAKAYFFKVAVSDKVGGGKYANIYDGTYDAYGNPVKIGHLKNGTKVLYIGTKMMSNKQMYKVMTSNGRTGYVWKENLTKYGAFAKKQIYYTTSKATIYKKNKKGDPVSNGTVDKGSFVFVYTINKNGWCAVRTMGGKSGYMKKGSLKSAF